MTKVNRRILLSIVTFLAVLCFGLALNVGVAPVAKAEGTLSIKSITQTYAQPYNGNSNLGNDKYNFSSIYIVEFDTSTALFSGSVGADITSSLSDFMNNTYWGLNAPKSLTAWSSYYSNGVKIYKYSNTAIQIYIYRPTYYTEFAFKEGATIGGKSITTGTWYQKKDLSFTTTAPTNLEIMAVYDQELAADNSGDYRTVNIAYNAKGSVSYNTFQYLKINGEYVYTDNVVDGAHVNKDLVKYYSAQGMDYSNDGDAPGGCYCRIYVNEKALIDGATITFPVGFTVGGKSLVKEQTFVLGNQGAGRSNINDQAVWGEQERIAEVKSVTQTKADGYSIYSTYDIEFENSGIDNSVSDIFLDYEIGEEVPNTLLAKLVINGNKFVTDGSTLTVTKHSANTLTLKIGRCIGYAALQILGGAKIGSWTLVDDGPVWYEQQDWTFNNTAPTETKVFALIAYATNSSSSVNLRLIFNMPIGNNTAVGHDKYGDSNLILSGMTVNGVQIANGTYDWCSVAGEKVFGGTQFNISASLVTLNNKGEGETIVSFVKGFGNTKKITQKQDFIVSHNDYSKWNSMPKFVELPMQTVNYKVGDSVISTVNDTTITLADPATIDGYSSEKTFIGWTDGEKLYKVGTVIRNLTEETTFTAVEIGSFAQAAPEVRTWGSAGVRFVTTFNTEDYALYEGKFFNGFGTIIARSADLTANNEKLTDVLTKDTTSVIVKIDSTIQATVGELTYVRGGIMEMYAHNFDKELVGAGYIAVEYATGVEYIVTAESKVVVKDVALNILSEIESGEASEEDFDMSLINAYAGINA